MSVAKEVLWCEGVARGDLAAIEASTEPRHALLRRAVRERLWSYVPGRLFLQAIITNRRGRAQRGINVTRFQ